MSKLGEAASPRTALHMGVHEDSSHASTKQFVIVVAFLRQSIGKSMKWMCCVMIRLYQLFLSPILGPHCRFYPSCSQYMRDAIQIHGVLKGFWLGLLRLAKCHPWHVGGIDPVQLNSNHEKS